MTPQQQWDHVVLLDTTVDAYEAEAEAQREALSLDVRTVPIPKPGANASQNTGALSHDPHDRRA